LGDRRPGAQQVDLADDPRNIPSAVTTGAPVTPRATSSAAAAPTGMWGRMVITARFITSWACMADDQAVPT
jgi:hypothetical protein